MIRGTLIKTTLVNYPGKVAAAYFMSGCNLYCPYCYNTELVENTLPDKDAVTPTDVLEHLKKRKNVLGGIVLSGGEPLIHPELADFISEIKKYSICVKIDTNGMLPGQLKALFNKKETSPDFVALDIKTAPKRYYELTRDKKYARVYEKNIQESIQFVSGLPANKREFRTVLVPPLVTEAEIKTIGALLPKDASWQFAEFRAENCIDHTYNSIDPYSSEHINQLVANAKKSIKNAELR
ncbi:MAG TPA: anaerobic ribonucleoside-triphosphate reductase activating protein [Treponemataceae bacterium]|nr:anaerobic ribonucleoside-triphosphate reductase activating protein [Treponemataceae bacterium]